MARPRGFDIADATETVLDVFWSRGYEGTAVRELCAATGQRPASLYAALGDKDQMFRAAMERYLRWIEGHLTPAADGRDGVRHVLETTARLTIDDTSATKHCIFRAVRKMRAALAPFVEV